MKTYATYFRYSFFLSTVVTLGLVSIPEHNHTQEYYDETKLIKDFLTPSLQPDQPISYWIDQLIGIFEKKHSAKEFTERLKKVRGNPHKVFDLLAHHTGQATTVLHQCFLKVGTRRAKEIITQRLTPKTAVSPVEQPQILETENFCQQVPEKPSFLSSKNYYLASVVALAFLGYTYCR